MVYIITKLKKKVLLFQGKKRRYQSVKQMLGNQNQVLKIFMVTLPWNIIDNIILYTTKEILCQWNYNIYSNVKYVKLLQDVQIRIDTMWYLTYLKCNKHQHFHFFLPCACLTVVLNRCWIYFLNNFILSMKYKECSLSAHFQREEMINSD